MLVGLAQVEARAAAVATRDVPVPEMGEGAVLRIRRLSARGWLEYQRAYDAGKASGDQTRSMALLITLCAVGEDGAPVFSRGEADVDLLLGLDYALVVRLCNACLELQSDQQEEAAGGTAGE